MLHFCLHFYLFKCGSCFLSAERYGVHSEAATITWRTEGRKFFMTQARDVGVVCRYFLGVWILGSRELFVISRQIMEANMWRNDIKADGCCGSFVGMYLTRTYSTAIIFRRQQVIFTATKHVEIGLGTGAKTWHAKQTKATHSRGQP